MKNRIKKILLTLMLAGSVTLLAAGCDVLKKEPETEATEAPTEKQTETEPPTESETESETEPPTESETESETEPQTQARRDLTVEEELAEATEFDTLRTAYASDNVNVREQPGTGDDVDIFASYSQGDTIIISGETPNWYMVDVDGYDVQGYVSKDFVSDTEVEPKSEEEIAAGTTDGAGETSTDDGAASETSAGVNSSVDAEYGVGAYAEPFEVVATAGANVRETPASDGEIISVVSSGTVVKVVGYTDRWYKIEYDGVVGYANQNLFATE